MCYSPPLLAGFRCRWWWAVPATPGWGPLAAVVCGVWCVVCGSGVLVGLWLVCGVDGPSPLLAEVPVCYSPPLLAGFRCRWWWAVPATPGWGPLAAVVCGVWCVVFGFWWWCVGGVVAGVWCGWSLATPGGGSCVLLPATPGWVSLPVVVGGPRHSWLGSAGGGGVWCVVCGVWQWCVGEVVAGVWCGLSLATPGGGSCVLLPATPGWVSLPVVVGGPRHSWLGSAGGGGVWCVVCGVWFLVVVCWWGCGWCVVWLVPRHSWRRFLCATPRHSWLGFAAGGGGRSPPLLAGVRWRRWCVVCGGGVLVGLWLVCGVVGPSPLLVEVPVCYSPPLLAGFRCRWWWAVPATPGWGPLAAVVCGVWCVVCVVWWRCVGGVVAGVWCGWFLATPGGGSCVLLPATPGWVSLPVVVGGPRHSWLGSAGGGGVWCVVCGVCCVVAVCWWGCGWCVVWLVPRHSWRRFLCATPRHSWLGFAAAGGGRSPPLLAGVRWRRWCVVCGGGVLVGLWLVCGVVGPSPLLAEVPVCYSPPLLAGFRCRWWWAVPATPGWGPLAAVLCGLWCVVCGVWWWCVGGVVAGVWCGWSLATPGGGSCVLLPATPGWVSLPVVVGGPRHSWLG